MEKKGTCTHRSPGWLSGATVSRSASGHGGAGGPAAASRAQLAALAMREPARLVAKPASERNARALLLHLAHLAILRIGAAMPPMPKHAGDGELS